MGIGGGGWWIRGLGKGEGGEVDGRWGTGCEEYVIIAVTSVIARNAEKGLSGEEQKNGAGPRHGALMTPRIARA